MDQQERLTKMKAAIIDFVSKAHEIPYLESVILFGSILEGDVNKKSDIDLLLVFDCSHNPEIGEESKRAIKISGDITYRYRIENNFSFVVINKKNIGNTDEGFLKKVEQEGLVIWNKGGFFKKHPGLRGHKLIRYSTKNLDQNTKKTIERRLYGYEVLTKQKGKVYKVKKQGLINQYGRKIAPGTILVPVKISTNICKLLDKHNVKYQEELFYQ